jgi:hypothetical protein
MTHLHDIQNLHQLLVCRASGEHLLVGMGVDDLIPQRAGAEVRALGNVGELSRGWLVDCASIDWPETSENAEKTALAACLSALT